MEPGAKDRGWWARPWSVGVVFLLLGACGPIEFPHLEEDLAVALLGREMVGVCSLAVASEDILPDEGALARLAAEVVAGYEELPAFEHPPGFTPRIRSGLERICLDTMHEYRRREVSLSSELATARDLCRSFSEGSEEDFAAFLSDIGADSDEPEAVAEAYAARFAGDESPRDRERVADACLGALRSARSSRT